MTDHAAEYAKNVARGIWDDYRAGHLFGYYDEEDGGTARTASDYLNEVLDIRVTTDWLDPSALYGAQLLITCGGPTAWIDTEECVLRVTWGTQESVRNLPSEFCHALQDALEELRDY